VPQEAPFPTPDRLGSCGSLTIIPRDGTVGSGQTFSLHEPRIDPTISSPVELQWMARRAPSSLILRGGNRWAAIQSRRNTCAASQSSAAVEPDKVEEPMVCMTLRRRELDSNFPYAGAMNLVFASFVSRPMFVRVLPEAHRVLDSIERGTQREGRFIDVGPDGINPATCELFPCLSRAR
jgi:hypothetical protein